MHLKPGLGHYKTGTTQKVTSPANRAEYFLLSEKAVCQDERCCGKHGACLDRGFQSERMAMGTERTHVVDMVARKIR